MQMTELAPFEEPPEVELNAPSDYYERHEQNPSLFFEDGIRSIDFVLVYNLHPQQAIEEENIEKRRVFEANLEAEGLELERTSKEKEHIYFVKVLKFKNYCIMITINFLYFLPFLLAIGPCSCGGFKTLCGNFEIAYAHEGGNISFVIAYN